jgi:hypothetical protein
LRNLNTHARLVEANIAVTAATGRSLMLNGGNHANTNKRPRRGRTSIRVCAVAIVATGTAYGGVLAADKGTATIDRNSLPKSATQILDEGKSSIGVKFDKSQAQSDAELENEIAQIEATGQQVIVQNNTELTVSNVLQDLTNAYDTFGIEGVNNEFYLVQDYLAQQFVQGWADYEFDYLLPNAGAATVRTVRDLYTVTQLEVAKLLVTIRHNVSK